MTVHNSCRHCTLTLPTECGSVCSSRWTEVKPERFITVPSGRHADPPLGPRPNRYALYFMACASEQNTLLLQRKHWATALEEGIRGRAVRKERGRYLLFTLQPAERLGFPQQTRSGFEMWSGTLVRRKGSEHREQCQICSSVISPIHHCLLRSATEPPGCKQHQLRTGPNPEYQSAAAGGPFVWQQQLELLCWDF